MKLAAIDIGSNAVRLLFVNVYEGKGGPNFKKADLVRVPSAVGELTYSLPMSRLIEVATALRAARGRAAGWL